MVQMGIFDIWREAENFRKVALIPETSIVKISAQSSARKVVKRGSKPKNFCKKMVKKRVFRPKIDFFKNFSKFCIHHRFKLFTTRILSYYTLKSVKKQKSWVLALK